MNRRNRFAALVVLLACFTAPRAEPPTKAELVAAGSLFFKSGISRSEGRIDRWTKQPYQVYNVPTTMLRMKGLSNLPNVGIEFGLTFDRGAMPNASLKELAALDNLTVLDMSNLDVSELALPDLKLFPKLETVILGGGKLIGDKGMKGVAGCKKLKSLDVYATSVTAAGLMELAACPSLDFLRVGRTGVPVAAVPGLKGLEVVGPFQVSAAQMKEWRGLKNLTHLHLPNCTLTEGAMAELAGMKQLVSLDLSGTNAVDGGLKALAALPALEVLHLNNTRVSNLGVKDLAGVRTLREVTLHETRVGEAGLAAVAEMPLIQQCTVSPQAITNGVLKTLAQAKRLHILQHPDFTRGRVAAVVPRSEEEVKSLYLANSAVTDAGLAELKGLTGLEMLWLEKTAVTDKGMVHVAALRGLKRLMLIGTKVTDKGLLELAPLDSLENIAVRGGAITAAGALAFRKLNPACQVER